MTTTRREPPLAGFGTDLADAWRRAAWAAAWFAAFAMAAAAWWMGGPDVRG
jgi:hypothetical protein